MFTQLQGAAFKTRVPTWFEFLLQRIKKGSGTMVSPLKNDRFWIRGWSCLAAVCMVNNKCYLHHYTGSTTKDFWTTPLSILFRTFLPPLELFRCISFHLVSFWKWWQSSQTIPILRGDRKGINPFSGILTLGNCQSGIWNPQRKASHDLMLSTFKPCSYYFTLDTT